MADTLTKKKRSLLMSKVKAKETKPEILVRKLLFSKGFRFRKNDKKLPGTPDIVLKKYKTAILVHGCFWHNHTHCKYSTLPKSRAEFWSDKINKNKIRDTKNIKELRRLGFQVLIVWECDLKKNKASKTIDKIERKLLKNHIV